jgi:hypothetical protein
MRRLARIVLAAKFLRRLLDRGVTGTADDLVARAYRLADRVARR